MTFRTGLLLIISLELLAAVLGISFYGWTTEGLQAVTRFSGRLSLVIFSVIFILLPYHKNKLTRVLSDSFFLLFAIAHGIHLAELLSYITLSGGKIILIRVAGGAIAYAFIFIMPFLINRVSIGKQALVENTYLFYIWFIFFMTYLPRIQGKLPQVGGSHSEFVILFVWVCILLAIRIVLILANRKPYV